MILIKEKKVEISIILFVCSIWQELQLSSAIKAMNIPPWEIINLPSNQWRNTPQNFQVTNPFISHCKINCRFPAKQTYKAFVTISIIGLIEQTWTSMDPFPENSAQQARKFQRLRSHTLKKKAMGAAISKQKMIYRAQACCKQLQHYLRDHWSTITVYHRLPSLSLSLSLSLSDPIIITD